ncbi:hypothetical protein BGW42_000559 [Actinomortierella wolfii]|nr:hypothetical protein BGW42_000559 [Actinomortierella wolfii]
MRPPRSTSGSSSAAAAAAVAMAVAAAAAARNGQEVNNGLHGRPDHKGSFAPGHASLTRRASASGSIVRSTGNGTNTTMEDAQLKAAIQAKARRSLLSSPSSPTSLRHLFKSGTSLTRSPSTSSTSSSSSSSTGNHPSIGGASSRVSVHDALDLQSRSWNRPRIDRYAGSIANSRRTQREYFDYPFTKSSLATISAGHHRSPLWTSGLDNSASSAGVSTSSGSPVSPPPVADNMTQSSSFQPAPLQFSMNDNSGLSASEMSPISPVVSGFPLPMQQQQQQQQPHHIQRPAQPSFQDELGAVHGMQMQSQQQYHPHVVIAQPQQQQQQQKEQVQQSSSTFHSMHSTPIQINPVGMMVVRDENQSQRQQQQYMLPTSNSSRPQQHQHQVTLPNDQHPPPRPHSRAQPHKRKSSQPNLQRRASSSCLLSISSTKVQHDGTEGLSYVSGQTPPPQRRMSLNLHLQYQQQQQPTTIEPLDLEFGSALFSVPMEQIQNAIKVQDNTILSAPQSQDVASTQMNVHIQPQHQQSHLHHQQQESLSRSQVQQHQQPPQPVLSPEPHVQTLQPDQPVSPILLRSSSTPAVSRPRIGPTPTSMHPLGYLANDDSILYSPSHPFGSMAQHALNMYAMTDKITQDLSIPQQYYQMTPQAQLATTLQQLQVQIQMVQLQHPQANQESKPLHQLPQPQPLHHRQLQPQGPSPPPLQVLSQHQQPAQPMPQQPRPQQPIVPSQAFFSEAGSMMFNDQNAISGYLSTPNTMNNGPGDTSMAPAVGFAEGLNMLHGEGSSSSQPHVNKEDAGIATLMDFTPFGGHMQTDHVGGTTTPSFSDTAMDSTAVDTAASSGSGNGLTNAALFSVDDSAMQATPSVGFGVNSMPALAHSPPSNGFDGDMETPPKPLMLKQQRRSIQVLPSHYQQQHYQQSDHSLSHFRAEGITADSLSSNTQQHQQVLQQQQVSQNTFVWSNGHQPPTYIPNGLAHLDLMVPQQQQFQNHPIAMQQYQQHQAAHSQQHPNQEQSYGIHPHHTFQPQTPMSFSAMMTQLHQDVTHTNNTNSNNNIALHPSQYEPSPASSQALAHSLPSAFSMEQAAHLQDHHRLQFEQQMQQLQHHQHHHQ